jgi:hypothetical protein
MVSETTCYMCSATATTTEHAPPKCFFPEAKDVGVDLRVNLVTVPSCDDHNTSRSKDDEYAMMFVVTHYETNPVARKQFSSKCIRALKRSPGFASAVFHRRRPVRIAGQSTVVVEVDRARFDRVMDHTCRALFFHEMGRQFLGDLSVWSPAFVHAGLESDADEAALAFSARQILQARPKRGRNQEVFWYQIFEEPGRLVAFRLVFYEGCSVYAVCTHGLPEQAA